MRELSRAQVEARIHNGELIVIYHGRALKLNSWIDRHPGGKKAIQHMIGRDASDEMDMYHSDEALKLAKVFTVGMVETPWKGFTPPIQGGVFRSEEEIKSKEEFSSGDYSSKKQNPDLEDMQAKVIDANIARELELDLEKYPTLDAATQTYIQDKFRALYDDLMADGWFNCNYWGYVRELSRISALFALSAYFWMYRDSYFYLFLSAVTIGLAWHQLTFIAHDAGHLAITHNYYIDNIFGVLIADFLGGLSLGWWKNNHNVHHIVTNDPIHDPDIQHLPFFAVSSRLFGSIYSTFYEKVLTYDAVAKVMLRAQHFLYYPILCFGRFNLYRLSWQYLILGEGPRKGKAAFLRYFEIVGLATFAYWYFYILCTKQLHSAGQRWLYIMVSHIVTMPVHVQITLSHFAQSTSDFGVNESFAQRQVRTTMDVACPAWFDYLHGGLQFQVIHHLFPRMPRHNFRSVQPKVIKFCDELGLHYTIYGFARGNKCVIDRLYDVAEQARVFNACNQFCRQEMVGGEAPAVEKAKREVMRHKSEECKKKIMCQIEKAS